MGTNATATITVSDTNVRFSRPRENEDLMSGRRGGQLYFFLLIRQLINIVLFLLIFITTLMSLKVYYWSVSSNS